MKLADSIKNYFKVRLHRSAAINLEELKPLSHEYSMWVAILLSITLLLLVIVPALISEQAIRLRDYEINIVAPLAQSIDGIERLAVEVDRDLSGFLISRKRDLLLELATPLSNLAAMIRINAEKAPQVGPEVVRLSHRLNSATSIWSDRFVLPLQHTSSKTPAPAQLQRIAELGKPLLENIRSTTQELRKALASAKTKSQERIERITRWSLSGAVFLGLLALLAGAYLLRVARLTSVLYRRAFASYREAIGRSNMLENQLSFIQTLLRHMPSAIAVIDFKDPVIKFGNRAFERMPFVQPLDVLDRKLAEVMIEDSGASEFSEVIRLAQLNPGTLHRLDEVKVSLSGVSPTFWGFRAIAFSSAADVKPDQILLLWEDVTLRRQAYDQVKAEHSRARKAAAELEVVIDNMGDGVVVVNSQNEASFINPQARLLLGVPPDLKLPQPLSALRVGTIEPLDMKRWNQSLGQEKEEAKSSRVTFLSSASKRLIEVIATPIRDEQGAIINIIGVVHDISEFKRVDQEKDEFLAMASHEIKTPLTVLDASCQLILLALKTHHYDQLERASRHLRSQLLRLKLLVLQVFDFANLQAERMTLASEPADLKAILVRIIDEDRTLSADHQFDLALPPEDVSAVVDVPRIEQVVNCLVTNAIRYSPKGSSIEVRLSVRDTSIQICVVDRGIGIPASDLMKIFRRFSRGSNVGNVAGMGIGLYVASEIVRAHQGRIWAESPGENHGSRFWIELPGVNRG